MSPTVVTTGLIVAAILAAWLRYDAGSIVLSWVVVFGSIGGAVASWIVRARRLPEIQLPRNVEDLGAREELTPKEEAQFADELRGWHREQQLDAWRVIERQGPGALIRARAALYFLWLALPAIVLLPARALPGTLPVGLPRSVVVLLPLAAVAIAVAVPLGIRDSRRARKALADQTTPRGRG